MPFDGAFSTSTSMFADRIDLIAAEAHEGGLGQAAVVLAQMAGLLRALGSDARTPATVEVPCSDEMYVSG